MNKPTPAWYSSRAADKFGASYWKHVDGHEVLVTGVCEDYSWSDKVFVGMVTQFSRHGFDGYWNEIEKQWEQYDQYDYEEYVDEK